MPLQMVEAAGGAVLGLREDAAPAAPQIKKTDASKLLANTQKPIARPLCSVEFQMRPAILLVVNWTRISWCKIQNRIPIFRPWRIIME